MTTPFMTDSLNSTRSRPSSLYKIRRPKDTSSAANSRPSSRPSSRPASRPVSPTPSISTPINVLEADPDQFIPTAIVIKNIPFSVKKDALLAKLSAMDVPAAYAFNYHFDNGVFRGLAFANYRTPEETEIVVNTINGLEIGGRKLRVEYKKVLPSSSESSDLRNKREMNLPQPESPSVSERRLPNNADEDALDLNDPGVLDLYSHLLLFRGDPSSTEVALSKNLTPKERRDAHLIADRLGLAHYSEGFGNDRQVIISKRGVLPASIIRLQHKNSRGSLRQSPSRDRLMINNNSNNNNSNNNSNDTGSKRDSGLYRKSMMSTSTTAEQANAYNIIHPIRQPRGPEPGKNFVSRKLPIHSSNNNDIDGLSIALARHLITDIGA